MAGFCLAASTCALLLLAAGDAAAQGLAAGAFATVEQANEHVRAGQIDDLGAPPLLSVLIEQPMTFEASAISFHYVWLTDERGERKPVWLARRRHAHGRDVTTGYADSRACLMISHVLQTAVQIERPLISLPGVPISGSKPPDLRDMMLDDWTYTLTAQGFFPTDDVDADLAYSGGSLSPLGAWARMADAALTPCWEGEEPIL